MGYVKTKGLVIKEVNTGEADKIITIFSRKHGKISGSAKNSRKTRNRLSAGTQLLCYSDFVLFKGKDIYSISSCDVIEPFYEIRNDIIKLTYAAHMLDLINDIVQEEQPATKMLQLFLNTLHVLAKTDKSPELITRIFELKLISILGYAPQVGSCTVCGGEEFSNVSFSFKKCGFICGCCIEHDKYSMKILTGTAKAINYIVYAKMDELFNFNLSNEVLNELGRVTRRYLRDRLEKDYTKLDYLKSLDM
ncbi:MAG: DNA repair protein RecO [Clostridia bacterium]|nr:DNA repair protein RecO [Clostridia bacterium]